MDHYKFKLKFKLAVKQAASSQQNKTSKIMPDQTGSSNLDKTIKPTEFTNVTLVPKDNKYVSAHSTILSISSPNGNSAGEHGFPCDKCEKLMPNQKKAKDLHMQTEHNIKTFKATPGPIKRSTTRTSIKCGVCSFVCKSGPSMKKHTEMLHNNDTAKDMPKEKKRQRNSYNCSSCNSTFVSNYMRNKHVKEQHEGKNILSPERKVARKEFEDKLEAGETEKDTVTIPRKELEDLHDHLLKAGKEKEDLSKRIEGINGRMYNLEKEKYKLEQETKYLKSENDKANVQINKLDSLYNIQVTDLKKTIEEKDIEIKNCKGSG